MGWLLMYRFYRFKMAAYWLLPCWVLMEIMYGTYAKSSGVAHWAHVGGFVFGALIAVAIRKTGLEQIAEKGIQEKVSWVSHPLLADASEQVEKGQLDQAIATLKNRSCLEKILQLEIKANDHESALLTCQEIRNAGEAKLPASLWLEYCRQMEAHSDVTRALDEYLELTKAYPAEKQGLLAQIAAGRIYLKKLHRPEEALQQYEAAQASSIPHADWQATLDRGIAEAKKALLPQTEPAVPVS
jgi:hypothetical protein